MRTKLFLLALVICFGFSIGVSAQDMLGRYDNPLTAEQSPVFNNQLTDISTNTWYPANTFPPMPTATYFQASAWLGDTLYVQDPGSGGTGATTIRRYTMNGTWTLGTPLPTAKVGGTLTACNGKLYFIAGGIGAITTPSTDVYQYTPGTGTWATVAPIPLAVAGHGAANWGDSVIFVVGGPYANSNLNLNVYYYRPASNIWGTITNSLPSGQGRRTFALGIEGNKLYMAGGFNTAFLNNFYIGTIGANASSLTWAAGPTLPLPPAITGISRPGGWAGFGKFYVICGERGSVGGYSDSVRVWDINASAWNLIIAGKPMPGSNIFAACVGNKINDTVKVFVPGIYNVTSMANFDVLQGNYVPPVGIIQTGEIATAYLLSQNYPNPFNPTSRINFAIPTSGNVKMIVTDVVGKRVAVLVDEFKTSGSYSVSFDASSLSSGIYFYTLSAGNFKETKKMLLIK